MAQVRPLHVVEATLRHLEDVVMDADREQVLEGDLRFRNADHAVRALDTYLFCWDRMRMLGRDLIVQHFRRGERNHVLAQDVLERMARYFILMDHTLSGQEEFMRVHKAQNLQQLNRTMIHLRDLYQDARDRQSDALLSPNEAEFVGYYVLLQVNEFGPAAACDALKHLPPVLLTAAPVRFAIDVLQARRTKRYVAFFRLLRCASVLQACLMARQVTAVRLEALAACCKAMCMRATFSNPVDLSTLVEWLAFDSEQEAAIFCEQIGLTVNNEPTALATADLTRSTTEAAMPPRPPIAEEVTTRPAMVHLVKSAAADLSARDRVVGESYPELAMFVTQQLEGVSRAVVARVPSTEDTL